VLGSVWPACWLTGTREEGPELFSGEVNGALLAGREEVAAICCWAWAEYMSHGHLALIKAIADPP